MKRLNISALRHVWLIDIDGTIVVHNGHKHGEDKLLPGVTDFWNSLPDKDVIVLLSARTQDEQSATLAFMTAQGLRYDHALFGMPTGERIVINDAKPSGLATAFAINVERDAGLQTIAVSIDPSL